ncbi:MAG TPA: glycosyl transferase, partial [Roseiflexaceae bacterium]|nr:glycosyl transferase [Roseiflexaceae bacterium]
DRYVLPTWPALLVLAGSGLAAFGTWLVQHIQRCRFAFAAAALMVLMLLEGVQLAWYHPYYLSYYNPLFGGGKVAERMFLIGWGEGMDQVGAYLQSRPDLQYGPVLSALGATLQPFVSVDVRDVEDFGKLPANYAVVYLESVQRAANPALYAQLQTTVPLHRVEIHGIEYARIYQLPRPYAKPLDAQFGDALRMRGVTVEHEPGRIVVTPAWDVRAVPAGDVHTFIHILDAAGTRVAQIDVAPGGGDAPPTNEWQPGQQIAVPLPVPLAQPLAPGTYSVVMGVYDLASNARLALQGGPLAPIELAGDNALLVEQLVIP